jgi:hypothetical protein
MKQDTAEHIISYRQLVGGTGKTYLPTKLIGAKKEKKIMTYMMMNHASMIGRATMAL